MNRRTATMLYLGMLIFVIAGMTYVIYYIWEYKEAFFNNPLIYGVRQYGEGTSCSCFQIGDAGDIRTFIVNTTGVYNNNPLKPKEINITL
jgi:hypothetical protein